MNGATGAEPSIPGRADAASQERARAEAAAGLPPLYAIADADTFGADRLEEVVAQLAELGVGCIQLRLKGGSMDTLLAVAERCAARLEGSPVRLWINDHPRVAAAVGAFGVHLGQQDATSAAARAVVGPGILIGRSTHDLAQAMAADADPAVDVIALGPIYPTRSKRAPDPVVGVEGLRSVCRQVEKPVVAIGGIDADRLPVVLGAGARSAAVIGALRSRGGDLEEGVRGLMDALPAGRGT